MANQVVLKGEGSLASFSNFSGEQRTGPYILLHLDGSWETSDGHESNATGLIWVRFPESYSDGLKGLK